MPEIRIPMDPRNPGQFYACCGLWELLALRKLHALAHFDLDPRRPRRAEFVVESDEAWTIREAMAELRIAKPIAACAELGSISPIQIPYGGGVLELDWWLDKFRETAEGLKCWAGQQTSGSIAAELLGLLPAEADEKLLYHAAMTSTRFGVDPRSAWNVADAGYSLNEHQHEAATFPAVEILAAVGLSGFRPAEERRRTRERRAYVYALWQKPLPRAVARLACCAPWEGLEASSFRFGVGKRGNYKYFRFSEPF
jgi:hypothetical protein